MKKELGFVLVVSLMFLMLSVPVSAWNPFDWFVTTPDDNPTPDEPLENMIPQEEARLKEIENRLIKYIEEGLFNLGAQEGWSDLSEEVKIRLLNKVDIKKALLRAGRPNAFVGGNGRCSSNEDCEPGLFCISGGGIFGFVFLGGEPDLCCNRGQMVKEGKCVLEGEHLFNFKSPSDEELQFLLEKLNRMYREGDYAADSVALHIDNRLIQAVGYTLEEINKIKEEVNKIIEENGGKLYLFIPQKPETHKEIPTTPEETPTDEDLSNKNMPSSIEPTTSQEPESQGPSADNFIPVVEESTLEEPQGPSAGVVRVEKHLPEEPGFVENLWSGIVDTVVDFFTPETETPKEPSQEIFATDIVLEESQQEQIPEEEGLVIPADFVVTVPDGEIPETTLVSGELDELKCNGRYEGSTCSYVDLQIATRGCSKKNEKCIECSLVNGVYHKAEGRCDFEVEHEKMA